MDLRGSQNWPGFGGCDCLRGGAGGVGRQFVLYDPDARGIGILDFDKPAHALGVVFCRPPLGELDLAPGPMHVDADEEIDGAVAAAPGNGTFYRGPPGLGWRALRPGPM